MVHDFRYCSSVCLSISACLSLCQCKSVSPSVQVCLSISAGLSLHQCTSVSPSVQVCLSISAGLSLHQCRSVSPSVQVCLSISAGLPNPSTHAAATTRLLHFPFSCVFNFLSQLLPSPSSVLLLLIKPSYAIPSYSSVLKYCSPKYTVNLLIIFPSLSSPLIFSMTLHRILLL